MGVKKLIQAPFTRSLPGRIAAWRRSDRETTPSGPRVRPWQGRARGAPTEGPSTAPSGPVGVAVRAVTTPPKRRPLPQNTAVCSWFFTHSFPLEGEGWDGGVARRFAAVAEVRPPTQPPPAGGRNGGCGSPTPSAPPLSPLRGKAGMGVGPLAAGAAASGEVLDPPPNLRPARGRNWGGGPPPQWRNR